MPSATELKLVEKIVRAKVKLESARRPHSDSCVVEMDPEGYAPCNCGASKMNEALNAAIKELEL